MASNNIGGDQRARFLTYAAVAATLIAVAFAASWLPARRATTIDPMVALRA